MPAERPDLIPLRGRRAGRKTRGKKEQLMKLKVLGLSLIAVFAVMVAVSSAASAAQPTFYECAKVAGGKYEKKCGKLQEGKGKGGYELEPGIGKGKTFKGKGGTATLHTPAVGGVVTCKAFKDEGKLTSPTTEGDVVSTFSGCESLEKKCHSPGQKAGTIVTNKLAGETGEIEGGSGAGVDLKPESGTYLAEFECEGLTVKVTGSVIGEETPVNKFTKTEDSIFQVNKEGYQQYKKFKGGPEDVLESLIDGTGPYESGQQAEAVNKGEELELKTS
jgi:hypothetical protein